MHSPFTVRCENVSKQPAIFKLCDGKKPFKECIDSLRSTYLEELPDMLPQDQYKFWVCGPEVSRSPDLYYFEGPDGKCYRWVQAVNVDMGMCTPGLSHLHPV